MSGKVRAKHLPLLRTILETVIITLSCTFFDLRIVALVALLVWYTNVTSQTNTGWLWSDLEEKE